MITIYSPSHREIKSSNLSWNKIKQYGYRLEPETEIWAFTNIPSQSGTISFKSIWANDMQIKDIKRLNLRSSIKYFITYSGDQLASALCPIIYDIGDSVATNHNFVDGDLSIAGLKGNGSTKYLGINFPASTFHQTFSCSLGCFVAEAATVMSKYMSVTSRVGGDFDLELTNDTTWGTVFLCSDNNKNAGDPTPGETGLILGSRTSDTGIVIQVNEDVYTGDTGIATMDNFNSFPVVLFAQNADNTNIQNYSDARIGMHLLCNGFSLAEISNFRSCIQNFNTRIGR